MSWRPSEGWKNPHSKEKRELRSGTMMVVANPAYYNYEAGADAMLEMLKARGFRIYEGNKLKIPGLTFSSKVEGKVVIIPEK